MISKMCVCTQFVVVGGLRTAHCLLNGYVTVGGLRTPRGYDVTSKTHDRCIQLHAGMDTVNEREFTNSSIWIVNLVCVLTPS